MVKRRLKTKVKTKRQALSIRTKPTGEVPAPREGEFYDMKAALEQDEALTRRASSDLMFCGEIDHFVVEIINPARANVHHTPTGKIYKYVNKDPYGWELDNEGRTGKRSYKSPTRRWR